MAALSQLFSEHTLDATDAFSYYATREELTGVPDDVVQGARNAAVQPPLVKPCDLANGLGELRVLDDQVAQGLGLRDARAGHRV